MPDYQKGKIYKLVGYGKTYYGSTTQPLCERKAGHKRRLDCMSKELFKLGDDIDIVLVESYPCNNKEELHQRERYYIENNECINKVIPTRTDKEYRENNKDKIKENKKKYNKVNKDKIKEKCKEYYENNKEQINEKNKEYRKNNKDKIKEIKNKYYEDNKEQINEKNKKYNEINKVKIKEWQNKKNICECGGLYTQSNKSRHFKTEKHKNFISKK